LCVAIMCACKTSLIELATWQLQGPCTHVNCVDPSSCRGNRLFLDTDGDLAIIWHHHKNSHRQNLQVIGPYKLRRMEGQDNKWFDTLMAWMNYGHAAMLRDRHGPRAASLVRTPHSRNPMPDTCSVAQRYCHDFALCAASESKPWASHIRASRSQHDVMVLVV
jgi:hypothetical protein